MKKSKCCNAPVIVGVEFKKTGTVMNHTCTKCGHPCEVKLVFDGEGNGQSK